RADNLAGDLINEQFPIPELLPAGADLYAGRVTGNAGSIDVDHAIGSLHCLSIGEAEVLSGGPERGLGRKNRMRSLGACLRPIAAHEEADPVIAVDRDVDIGPLDVRLAHLLVK